MILEALVTTLNENGEPNIAPMGPEVNHGLEHFVLRPYTSSTTYANLKRTGAGVLHITDNVELFARAAVGALHPPPELLPATGVPGVMLAEACRWFSFRVTRLDDSRERTEIACTVVAHGTQREFFGFNRAKHAVLEAAILATRMHILPADEIRAQFAALAVIVQKTACDQERRAFHFLEEHVQAKLGPWTKNDAGSPPTPPATI